MTLPTASERMERQIAAAFDYRDDPDGFLRFVTAEDAEYRRAKAAEIEERTATVKRMETARATAVLTRHEQGLCGCGVRVVDMACMDSEQRAFLVELIAVAKKNAYPEEAR